MRFVGSGVRLDAPGEFVEVPQVVDNTVNFDFGQGTANFCYRPNYNHTDGGEHALFSTSEEGGAFILARVSAANDDGLQVMVFANSLLRTYKVEADDYELLAGEWYRISISWDFVTVGAGEANIHVYLDGVDMPLSNLGLTGPMDVPPPSAEKRLRIGARVLDGQAPEWWWAADGVIDEFRVYDRALVP